ncbi:hypothetical protein EDD21DRAFT_432107 [Dissophora ornata]|nr:hypothetical protein EDD21DRAFT_432107 [Dissophora ornata]
MCEGLTEAQIQESFLEVHNVELHQALSDTPENCDDDDSEIHRVPSASTSFAFSRNDKGQAPALEIAISYDASKIAVFPSASFERKQFPDVPGFQVLEYSASFTPALQTKQQLNGKTSGQILLPPGTLAPSTQFQPDTALLQLAGHGKFHFFNEADKDDMDIRRRDSNEVFVACDGVSVWVYGTHKSWSQMYSLPLTILTDIAQSADENDRNAKRTLTKTLSDMQQSARILINSLHGPLCAWRTSEVVMVLNLQTADTVSHFQQYGRKTDSCVAFSPDGAMVAIAREHFIWIYMLYGQSPVRHASFESDVMSLDWVAQGRQLLVQMKSFDALLMNPMHLEMTEQRVSIPISNYDDMTIVRTRKRFVVKQKSGDDRVTEQDSDDKTEGLPTVQMEDVIFYTHEPRLSVHPLEQSSYYEVTKRKITCTPDQEQCDEHCRTGQKPLGDLPQECISPSGLCFRLQFRETLSPYVDRPTNNTTTAVVITMTDPTSPSSPTQERMIQSTIHFCSYIGQRAAFFLPGNTRYIILGDYYIQIWKLPTDAVCELLAMKSIIVERDDKFERDDDLPYVLVCCHGNTAYFKKHSRTYSKNRLAYTWFDFSEVMLLNSEHADACINSIPFIIGLYREVNEDYRKALLQYAVKHINSYPDPHDESRNVISRILWSKKAEAFAGYSIFLRDLLAYSDPKPTWFPKAPFKKETNPLSCLLDIARIHPKFLATATVLVDYCARMAKSERNIGFVSMIVDSLPEMIEYHPDFALGVMRKIAFVPVNNNIRRFVVDHALVRPSPTVRSSLRRIVSRMSSSPPPPPLPVVRFVQPVFQMQSMFPSHQIKMYPIEENENFTMEVYVAPFEVLWRTRTLNGTLPGVDKETTWWKSILAMLLWKTKPTGFKYIRTHAFQQDFFDNPMIAGLVEYKWNTFASSYWLTRFTFQCFYYLLVLVVTLLQVYSLPSELTGALIAIIVLASGFLWLELLQFMKEPGSYLTSPYNYVDLSVFLLPLTASLAQLVDSEKGNDAGNTRAFSFAILVIYVHLLFELRVIKSVCNFVSIILSVIIKIRIFFIIFAVSIFAFTHAFLHLLWAKSVDGEDKTGDAAGFPYDFAGALSATYFFMGGRYDPVGDKFATDDVSFHVMMALYFFLTVILMLNVLIALINVAFTTGDDSWRPVWLENRLYHAENAENMSHHIPGFRRTHSWFPREIYYTATAKEVQEFNDRYFKESDEKGAFTSATTATPIAAAVSASTGTAAGEKRADIVTMLDKAASTTAATAATSERTEEIDHRLEAMQKKFDTSLKEIQEQADRRQEKADAQYEALQMQLKELTALLRVQQNPRIE